MSESIDRLERKPRVNTGVQYKITVECVTFYEDEEQEYTVVGTEVITLDSAGRECNAREAPKREKLWKTTRGSSTQTLLEQRVSAIDIKAIVGAINGLDVPPTPIEKWQGQVSEKWQSQGGTND